MSLSALATEKTPNQSAGSLFHGVVVCVQLELQK